jgi:hypothetical protein
MVYDGWKAELTLTAGGGVLLGSDGIRRSVRVVTKPGSHIVFYVGGLGGENADGQGGQKFEGYQMTQTHDAIAGLTWWQGQTFGFYAIKH